MDVTDVKASYEKTVADSKAVYEKAVASAKVSYDNAINKIESNGKSSASSGTTSSTTSCSTPKSNPDDPLTVYNKTVSDAKAAYKQVKDNPNSTQKQIDAANKLYLMIKAEAKANLDKSRLN